MTRLLSQMLWPNPHLVPAELTESPAPDTNPGRGWYQIFTLDLSAPVNRDELQASVSESDRLVLLLIDIGSCRACDLTEELLEHLRQILAFFAEQRQEMIVRIVYDTVGRGLEREPPSLQQVLRHIRQIGPVLRQFSGHIHTLQGLFVGSWGEMHGSRYLSDEHLKLLAETLWDATGGSCFLAVRTPRQRRVLEQSKLDMQKVGLFVDGLFGSETHLGTFGADTDQQELAYCKANCGRAPNGGETVLGEPVSPQRVIQTLRSMHLTYLNRVYDARVLERWERELLRDGQNLRAYVGNRLGYRFVVKNVRLKITFRKATLFLTGENQGFGSFLRESEVWLYGVQNGAAAFSRRLDADPREWDSQKEFSCRCVLPGRAALSQSYELYLKIKARNGETIRFANAPGRDAVFLGSLYGWELS